MSGLFRRLAGQALGQPGATQLHALARLPYQAAPSGRVETTAPWSVEPQPAVSPQLSEHQALKQQSPRRSAAPHTPPGSLPALAPRATRTRPQDAAAIEKAAAAMLGGIEPALASSSSIPPTEPYRTSSSIQIAAEQAPPPRSTLVQPAPLFLPFADKVPTPVSATPSAPRYLAAVSVPPSETVGLPEQPTASLTRPDSMLPPAPLLPPRHDAPVQAARTAERQREPDEVHVHIGRIEITAVQQPAPAKRASRKGQAPLSLDDYLARRKGDGA